MLQEAPGSGGVGRGKEEVKPQGRRRIAIVLTDLVTVAQRSIIHQKHAWSLGLMVHVADKSSAALDLLRQRGSATRQTQKTRLMSAFCIHPLPNGNLDFFLVIFVRREK